MELPIKKNCLQQGRIQNSGFRFTMISLNNFRQASNNFRNIFLKIPVILINHNAYSGTISQKFGKVGLTNFFYILFLCPVREYGRRTREPRKLSTVFIVHDLHLLPALMTDWWYYLYVQLTVWCTYGVFSYVILVFQCYIWHLYLWWMTLVTDNSQQLTVTVEHWAWTSYKWPVDSHQWRQSAVTRAKGGRGRRNFKTNRTGDWRQHVLTEIYFYVKYNRYRNNPSIGAHRGS